MKDNIGSRIIGEVVGALDIPPSAYEKAYARYKNLGEWFSDTKAACNKYDPHIYPQGSFRLGTVIRPFDENGEYDLDVGCRLRKGVTKANCSQKTLKNLVGGDVEAYRVANSIKEAMEPKHRCWRLKYADQPLRFHLDVVPSIPEDAGKKIFLQESLARSGLNAAFASRLADFTGAITDDRDKNYALIDPNWHLSNSEGFALWFEARMEEDVKLRGRILLEAKAAKVDRLPAYKWKSTLQRVVQILKAHRDQKFSKDPDGKPASIIITTLAARAYRGQEDIAEALGAVLVEMPRLIAPTTPRVPNPVNPAEDFADRWTSTNGLEQKFRWWLSEAQRDFDVLLKERRPELIVEAARSKFGASLNLQEVTAIIQPGSSLLRAAAVPAGLSFPDKPVVPQKPSGFA